MISFSRAANRTRVYPRVHRAAGRLAASALAAALLALLAPAPAHAGGDTLRRSAQNLLFAPLDLALSPVVAGAAVWRNWQESDDARVVQIAYPLPGYLWLTTFEAGSSVMREVAGGLELIPGVALAFFPSAEMDPFFEPPESNDALVDAELPAGFEMRFGIDYTEQPGQD